MATWKSAAYDGRYLQLDISESVNVVGNSSTLSWTLTSTGGASTYYTIDTTTVTINGTTVYSKDRTYWDDRVFPAKKGSVSGTITVAHDSNGSKTIAKSGSVTVTLSVTDSRGYTAETSQTVTVIPYTKPKISSITLRRTNDIEAEMQLKFSGSISAVTVDGTQKNSVVYVRYRYKKTSESSYGSYTSIYSGTTKSGTSFSYSNLELCSLDANSSYDFHLQIQDKLYSLSSLDLYFTVPQGTPLIALRKKKVGINTPAPQATLDVAGDMRVDGSPLADFVIQQGTSGIWNYRKWKSGTAECWGQYSFTTAISTAWGVLYESGAIALPNFPFTFAEIPHVHISTENSNYAMFVERGSSSSWSTTTNPGKIFAVRPNTVPSATYKVSIYAIGKV